MDENNPGKCIFYIIILLESQFFASGFDFLV